MSVINDFLKFNLVENENVMDQVTASDVTSVTMYEYKYFYDDDDDDFFEVYPKTKQGTQNRSFSALWYNNFPWLEYSIEANAICCYVCRIFDTESLEDTFVKTGFNNWKKVSFNYLCVCINFEIYENTLYLHHSLFLFGS